MVGPPGSMDRLSAPQERGWRIRGKGKVGNQQDSGEYQQADVAQTSHRSGSWTRAKVTSQYSTLERVLQPAARIDSASTSFRISYSFDPTSAGRRLSGLWGTVVADPPNREEYKQRGDEQKEDLRGRIRFDARLEDFSGFLDGFVIRVRAELLGAGANQSIVAMSKGNDERVELRVPREILREGGKAP